MEYRVWSVVNGADDREETFSSPQERDEWAAMEAHSLRRDGAEDWEVYIADVTEGCSVGEFSGEEAVVFASSEDQEPEEAEDLIEFDVSVFRLSGVVSVDIKAGLGGGHFLMTATEAERLADRLVACAAALRRARTDA